MGARMCPGWTARSYETRTQREDNLVLLRALTRSCYFSALFWFAYVDPKESLMNEYGVVLGTGNTALHAIINIILILANGGNEARPQYLQ